VLNVDRLAELGWSAVTPLSDGLARTYEWFTSQQDGTIRGMELVAQSR